MKLLPALIMLLHGAIHLLGFAKGFNLAKIPDLTAAISRTEGSLWLAAAVLWLLAALLSAANKTPWIAFAAAGLIFSMILIAKNWRDAKYGMIPNLVVAILVTTAATGCAFKKKVVGETEVLLQKSILQGDSILTTEEITHLPVPVQRWLTNSGAVGKNRARTVWLQQDFKLKMQPNQEKWHYAKAQQYFNTIQPSFVWTIKLNMMPLITITGRDKFVDGKGEMQMKLNGALSLGKESGSKMDEGTLQRYLGETVWFPWAVLDKNIIWEEIDSLTAKATMTYKGTTGSGTFHFNANGDFVKFSAWRYKGNDPNARRHEWIITANGHAIFDGVKIPSKCHATWMLDERPWTWCELEVTDLVYNPSKQLSNPF